MGWSNFPISTGDDLTLGMRFDEIRGAIKERFDILYYQYRLGIYDGFDVAYWLPTVTGWADVAPGEDIQAATFYSDMQHITESIVHNFYNHVADLTPFDGVVATSSESWRYPSLMDWDPYDSQWTLNAWRAAAGIHTDGFERRIPDGAGGWTVGRGHVQVGDYIGPWIFEELKEGLSLLTSRMYLTPAGANNYNHVYFGVGGGFREIYQGAGETSAAAQANFSTHAGGFAYSQYNEFNDGAIGTDYILNGSQTAPGIATPNRDKYIGAPVRQWLLMTKFNYSSLAGNNGFSDFGYGLTEFEWSKIADSALNIDETSFFDPVINTISLKAGTVDFSDMPLPFLAAAANNRSSNGMMAIEAMTLPSNPITAPPSIVYPNIGSERFSGSAFIVDFSTTFTYA